MSEVKPSSKNKRSTFIPKMEVIPPIVEEPIAKDDNSLRIQKINQDVQVEKFEPRETIINLDENKEPAGFWVRVTHPSLRKRRAPDTQAEVIGYITDFGRYKIINEKSGWGELLDGSWIMLRYTETDK